MRRMVSQEKLSILDNLKNTENGLVIEADVEVKDNLKAKEVTTTTLELESLVDVNGETGSDGQVLMSDGEVAYWGNISSGVSFYQHTVELDDGNGIIYYIKFKSTSNAAISTWSALYNALLWNIGLISSDDGVTYYQINGNVIYDTDAGTFLFGVMNVYIDIESGDSMIDTSLTLNLDMSSYTISDTVISA